MKQFKEGDVVTKKSGKPFKSGNKEEVVVGLCINQQDPKKRAAVVFADGSVCNVDMLVDNC